MKTTMICALVALSTNAYALTNPQCAAITYFEYRRDLYDCRTLKNELAQECADEAVSEVYACDDASSNECITTALNVERACRENIKPQVNKCLAEQSQDYNDMLRVCGEISTH